MDKKPIKTAMAGPILKGPKKNKDLSLKIPAKAIMEWADLAKKIQAADQLSPSILQLRR